jgi:hypothetical protein
MRRVINSPREQPVQILRRLGDGETVKKGRCERLRGTDGSVDGIGVLSKTPKSFVTNVMKLGVFAVEEQF